jgi:1,4-dihydroxy-2-naphthoyl-CoA hydrolase
MSPLDNLLGIEITAMSREKVTARITLDPARHHQPWGIVHGGLWCTVVETLASVGTQQWAGPGQVAVGLENHTSFLRMARTGVVHAEAVPLSAGRTTQIWTVSIRDEDGHQLAYGTCRLLLIRDRDKAPQPSDG